MSHCGHLPPEDARPGAPAAPEFWGGGCGEARGGCGLQAGGGGRGLSPAPGGGVLGRGRCLSLPASAGSGPRLCRVLSSRLGSRGHPVPLHRPGARRGWASATLASRWPRGSWRAFPFPSCLLRGPRSWRSPGHTGNSQLRNHLEEPYTEPGLPGLAESQRQGEPSPGMGHRLAATPRAQ